jgi:hypothetical protein
VTAVHKGEYVREEMEGKKPSHFYIFKKNHLDEI